MFICNKCNKEFKTKQHYNNHLARKNPCVKQIYKCDNCLQEFKSNQYLNQHLNRKFKCQKIDLERKNIELKHQLEIVKIQTCITNNNNITNIILYQKSLELT